ncbi:F-box/FBD/LRR-repeat protein At1g13570, partial [Linum grandiflorum]
MCLPLRDAVKSSILSTKWRNLWTTLPTLVIDQTFSHEMVARPSKDYNMEVIAKLIMSDVCKVLMLHRGPLKDLSLSLSQFDHQILRFLPFQTMESLTITNGGNCNISKIVFSSFSQLNKLCLSDCLLAFSSVSFEGFDRLTVLELRNVMFGADQPQLRFICPVLATLILDRCDSYFERPCIVIEETLLLECFYLVGCFGHVRLRQCALLNKVVICATDSTSLQLSGAFSKV